MIIQLDRKQLIVLALALLLAVASWWIPTPHKASPIGSTVEPSNSTPHLSPMNSAVLANRESVRRDHGKSP